jgi:CRISPR system Cascade subunit CasE
MYLSKLELNLRSREARRDLNLPYELHRTLATAFITPEGQDYRATHSVLFRVESSVEFGARPVVLVQSVTAPSWNQLPPDYTRQPVPCKPFNPTLTVGQVLGFRLVANPTKKVAREGRRQGNRVPLLNSGGDAEVTPAQQWLLRKGALCGFEVLHVVAEDFRPASTRPVGNSGQHAKQQLPLYGVRFDGLLRVSDPHLLNEAIRQGIGPAKAFGFGLLSLAAALSVKS